MPMSPPFSAFSRNEPPWSEIATTPASGPSVTWIRTSERRCANGAASVAAPEIVSAASADPAIGLLLRPQAVAHAIAMRHPMPHLSRFVAVSLTEAREQQRRYRRDSYLTDMPAPMINSVVRGLPG